MTLAAITRCSQSRPAYTKSQKSALASFKQIYWSEFLRLTDGSSSRKTLAGLPRHSVIATRWSSPPERFRTFSLYRLSILRGFMTYKNVQSQTLCPLIQKNWKLILLLMINERKQFLLFCWVGVTDRSRVSFGLWSVKGKQDGLLGSLSL